MQRNEPPRKVGHCTLDILPHGKPYNLTSIDIARHMDHSDSIKQIAQLLKPQVEQIGATHLALPPVMGIEKANDNIKQLESELGVKCFELLSMPPSIPGVRLQRALDRMLVSSGGRLLIGYEATSAKHDDKRINSVNLQSSQRQIRIQSKSVILATGKFIGGGIKGDERGFREPIFNLIPVTEEFYSAASAIPLRHTSKFAFTTGGQPFLASGLSIDFTLRPIDKDGAPAFENLFSAGSVIAGYNYSAEKSGLGVSLVTGYTAGLFAGAYSKGRKEN
jgi:glycerol-3-phosphate dehydrogenase subunit B